MSRFSSCVSNAFVFSVLLAMTSCGQGSSPESESLQTDQTVGRAGGGLGASAESVPEDVCGSYSRVAIDFVNLYTRHLKNNEISATPVDTYDWLRSNSLAGPDVASAYAEFDLIDGDPILDAQDYPDKYELLSCSAVSGLVQLQGVGSEELKVSIKVGTVEGSPKVIGVGSLNMQSIQVGEAANELPDESRSAATYCGWIDDAKFGATLTDRFGIHSLSTAAGGKEAELQYAMKEWPSCGCITGSLDDNGDFSTISSFEFKSTSICSSDRSLSR